MPSPESLRIRAGLVRYPPAADIAADRAGWEGWAATQPLPLGVVERLETVAGVSGRRLIAAGDDTGGLIVAFHGGGLVSGASITHRALGAELALATGQPVFLPDYRRLPEHTPEQVLADGCAVLTELRRSPRLNVFADSSGAALALASMQALRDSGDRLPDRVVFLSAAVDATLAGDSFAGNASVDPTLSPEALRHWRTVVGAVAPLDHPLLSPLFQPVHDLPPMLLLAGSDELWRDDSVRLAARVAAAGGVADLQVFDGMWHVWSMSGDMPETRQAFGAIADFVR